MFRLVKILHSGVNVPEPTKITLSTPATAVRGTPFSLKYGVLVPTASSMGEPPAYFLLKDVNDETEILCAPIPVGAIFSTTVKGNPNDMTEGMEYLLTEDSSELSATLATEDTRGAYLFNKNGAKVTGDEILVTFPIR